MLLLFQEITPVDSFVDCYILGFSSFGIASLVTSLFMLYLGGHVGGTMGTTSDASNRHNLINMFSDPLLQ